MDNHKDRGSSLFWELTGKVMDHEATQEECEHYRQILKSNPELSRQHHFLVELRNKHKHIDLYDHINVSEDWLEVRSKTSLKQHVHHKFKKISFVRRVSRRTLPYAAALAGLMVVFCFAYFLAGGFDDPSPTYTSISAPMGSRTHVLLPDGTDIWLNAGSTLRYDNTFNESSRRVHLSGEAFFAVGRQEVPFVVTTHEINVHALGTSFNIKAYRDDEVIETTLVSGSILIEKADPLGPGFQQFVLEPNQKAIFYKSERLLTVNQPEEAGKSITTDATLKPIQVISQITIQDKNNVIPEIGWKDGILVFEREPLRKLIRRLERRYEAHFIFKDENLKDYFYTGTLKELTLEQVLRAIKLTSPIDYLIEDKTVILTVNPETIHKYETQLINN